MCMPRVYEDESINANQDFSHLWRKEEKETLKDHPGAAVSQHTPSICGTTLFADNLFFVIIIENAALN